MGRITASAKVDGGQHVSEGLVVTSEQALDASKEVGDWPDRTQHAGDHGAVERGEPEMQIRGDA